MVVLQSDLRSGTLFQLAHLCSDPFGFRQRATRVRIGPLRAEYDDVAVKRNGNVDGEYKKPKICTADELHYATVPNSNWRLALWRYLPSPKAPKRNHPLLLLSGLATNAIGYDLSPESSFARYMSGQGFDTWILEVRGAGLSEHTTDFEKIKQPLNAISEEIYSTARINGDSKVVSKANNSNFVSKLLDDVSPLSPRLSGRGNGGHNSQVDNQLKGLARKLVNVINEDKWLVPPQLFDLRERLSMVLQDFQKPLELIMKFDWDFDHYLEEDVPAAMEYVRTLSKPKDGKLLAVGHSMGGILLYARLSRYCFEGKDAGLKAVATLASSLDYTTSKSSLRLLLPLADPLQALNVPVLPVGALIAAAFPFAANPPYVLSWLNSQISAKDMMQPELFEKLALNNFCTVPIKLLMQLSTAFQDGGLRDRSGKFFYKNHLRKSNIPILAIAGDQDLICPPEAVYETVKLIPEHLVTYKVLGEPSGPHYAHYDLVGSRSARYQVYPRIVDFLTRHDRT